MAGGHARRRNCENQQSRRRISVLHEAVLSGEEIHICRCQGSERDRQNVVLPLLEEYFAWLKSIHLEKGSKLEDAVRYSLNRKQQLMAFLDYGDVPISNNLAENAIRPFVVGRKNWLFCDSVKGAESSAIVYSLVETAKANGIEPYGYLLLVLSMLPYLGKSPTHEELEKLMPWHPAVRHREHIRK